MENPLRISEEAKFYHLLKRRWIERIKEITNFKGKVEVEEILDLIGEDRSLSIIVFYLVGALSTTKNGKKLIDKNSKEYSKKELKELIEILKEKERENLLWYVGRNARYLKKQDIVKLIDISRKLNKFKIKNFYEGVSYFIGSGFFRKGKEKDILEVALVLSKIKPTKNRLIIKEDEIEYFKRVGREKKHKYLALFIEDIKNYKELTNEFEELVKAYGKGNEEKLISIIRRVKDKKKIMENLAKIREELKSIKKHLNRRVKLKEEEMLRNALINVLGIVRNVPYKNGEEIVDNLVKNNKGEYLRINLFKVYLFTDMGFSYKKLMEKTRELGNEKLLYYLREIYDLVRGEYFKEVEKEFV